MEREKEREGMREISQTERDNLFAQYSTEKEGVREI